MNVMRWLVIGFLGWTLAGCGGKGAFGSSGSGNQIAGSGANVATAVVNAGPDGDANTLFTSVTICAPGSTTNCQTIDNIEIDTGSSGLRILASVLTADLPIQSDGGNAIAECTQFAGGTYSWGPIALADLTISGESAASLPVQVIGDSNFATVPASCMGTGTAEDTVMAFGANGVLGVGTTAADCGPACADTVDNGFYYTCSTGTDCVPAAIATASQVQNPVTFFATDNNGVIIELPSVAAGGAVSVTGAIVFGIDTESNNASGSSAKPYAVATTTGFLTVNLGGMDYPESFLDTGSNGYYFNDSSDAALVQCTDAAGFYCPTSTLNLSATICAYNADGTCSGETQSTVNFSIGNAETLFSNASYSAFPTLGGTFATNTSVDLGLPFFYGRNVYEVFEGHSSSAGTGPYVAF